MKNFFLALGVLTLFLGVMFLMPQKTEAGYVSGYYRGGTYVKPYYRSNSNAYKWDNYSYAGGSRYNSSYYYPTRNYSGSWYTPSYLTQNDYYLGKSYYNWSNSWDY